MALSAPIPTYPALSLPLVADELDNQVARNREVGIALTTNVIAIEARTSALEVRVTALETAPPPPPSTPAVVVIPIDTILEAALSAVLPGQAVILRAPTGDIVMERK